MRILTISGSLRAGSSNTAALQALALLAPAGITVERYDDLAGLPAFNPDLDGDDLPVAVRALRGAVARADALVISSPEYARGIAGSLKNLLDWLVSGPEVPGKRVALVSTSPRAVHAPAQLRTILVTMSATVVEEACIALPLLGRAWDAPAIAADPAMAKEMRRLLDGLTTSVAISPSASAAAAEPLSQRAHDA